MRSFRTIIQLLKAIYRALTIHPIVIVKDLSTNKVTGVVTKGVIHVSANLKDTAKGYGYQISWGNDAAGNPNSPPPLPSAPIWSVDAASPASVTPAKDGMSAQVLDTGKLGTVTVTVSIPASTDGVSAAQTLTDTYAVVGAEGSTAALQSTPL